jgi:quinol monooxygenase YgiN
MKKKHTVVCILEANPNQENELKEALQKVASASRNEDTCIEYRLHQDKNHPTKFVLYENWTNQEDHQKQFQKPYILELGQKLEGLLASPVLAFFAEEIQ